MYANSPSNVHYCFGGREGDFEKLVNVLSPYQVLKGAKEEAPYVGQDTCVFSWVSHASVMQETFINNSVSIGFCSIFGKFDPSLQSS